MLFADLAGTSAAVAATSGRLAKVKLLAAALRDLAAGGDPAEMEAGAAYLAGEMRQRQIGVGWASLRDLPPAAEAPSLSVLDIDRGFADLGAVNGTGSQARRRDLVQRLFGAATADEQRLLRGIISGEVRQGAQAGLLADAIASAAGVHQTAVRRALLLSGDLRHVAVAALTGGEAALGEFTLTVGRPLAPMLAQAANTVDEALAATGVPASVDAKLDGIRIQVHRDGDDVAVFSRSLDDLTGRVPEIVAAVRALPLRSVGPRRGGPRGRPDRAGPAVPGDVGSGRAARAGRAGPVLLRRAAPRRRGPGRRARQHPMGRARPRRPGRDAGRPYPGRLSRGGQRRVRRGPATTVRRAWW